MVILFFFGTCYKLHFEKKQEETRQQLKMLIERQPSTQTLPFNVDLEASLISGYMLCVMV